MENKYKKLIKSFGGYALYFDKKMLRHLQLDGDDEVRIRFEKDSIIIEKSKVSDDYIQELLTIANI